MSKPNIHLRCPPTFEKWCFENPDTVGIGGSESAAAEMAHRLAARGYNVTVYAPLPDHVPSGTVWRGTVWRALEDTDYTAPGVWILSRCPELADEFAGPAARPDQALWCVCQDEDYPRAWWMSHGNNTPERVFARMDKLTRVVALCGAQADHYRSKYPRMARKVCQSSNGLRRELVEEVLAEADVPPRNPHRIMYASSPDRALAPLLGIFARVRERVPDAELWVAYGFDNIEKLLARVEALPPEERSPQDVRHGRWIAWLKRELQKPGIRHFGRMPQRELYRLWRQCGLWIYPVRFRETSAVTCMEGQALGAVPIVCPVWAIGENVQYGVKIREHEPTDNEDGPHTATARGGFVDDPLTLARFADEAVRLMRAPEEQERVRREMMPWAARWFDYERWVSQWARWIESDLPEGGVR